MWGIIAVIILRVFMVPRNMVDKQLQENPVFLVGMNKTVHRCTFEMCHPSPPRQVL